MDIIISALQTFYTLVEEYNSSHPKPIFWILSGSVSLAIQGVDILPRQDIDILTDETGAQALDILLSNYVVTHSSYSSTDKYRSFFGIYNLDGVQIEVMGDFQYLQKNGSRSPENQRHPIFFKEFSGMHLPLLSLEQELREYEHVGNVEKIQKIQAKLRTDVS